MLGMVALTTQLDHVSPYSKQLTMNWTAVNMPVLPLFLSRYALIYAKWHQCLVQMDKQLTYDRVLVGTGMFIYRVTRLRATVVKSLAINRALLSPDSLRQLAFNAKSLETKADANKKKASPDEVKPVIPSVFPSALPVLPALPGQSVSSSSWPFGFPRQPFLVLSSSRPSAATTIQPLPRVPLLSFPRVPQPNEQQKKPIKKDPEDTDNEDKAKPDTSDDEKDESDGEKRRKDASDEEKDASDEEERSISRRSKKRVALSDSDGEAKKKHKTADPDMTDDETVVPSKSRLARLRRMWDAAPLELIRNLVSFRNAHLEIRRPHRKFELKTISRQRLFRRFRGLDVSNHLYRVAGDPVKQPM
jgi:hypothetical protein